ncbi:MAG: 16S rRNA (guanine(966)-N(2))-methyltransferase RsmD [bacterium]
METVITGGVFKGRRLILPKGSDVRPTMGFIREAIFNIIGEKVLDAEFLDLFAGFGTVGIEALSRGARFVSFVERNPRYSYVISENLKRLESSNFKIYTMSVDTFIINSSDRYDIIFLDPPYILGDLNGIMEKIFNKGLLASGGIIIWEAFAKNLIIEDRRFNIIKEKIYGDTRLIFIKGD